MGKYIEETQNTQNELWQYGTYEKKTSYLFKMVGLRASIIAADHNIFIIYFFERPYHATMRPKQQECVKTE